MHAESDKQSSVGDWGLADSVAVVLECGWSVEIAGSNIFLPCVGGNEGMGIVGIVSGNLVADAIGLCCVCVSFLMEFARVSVLVVRCLGRLVNTDEDAVGGKVFPMRSLEGRGT